MMCETPYIYTPEIAQKDFERKANNCNRVWFAILLDDIVIGDVYPKNIDLQKGSGTLSIVLIQDCYKEKGYGTAVERTVLEYGFKELGLSVIYADVVTINIPQKIPAMHFLSDQSIQRSDPSFAAAFHKLVHLRSRLFPAKQKVGNHLFIKRHPTTSIDFNFYFLFLGFGAGNSSYMALNRPVKNCLLSTSSTNSISFAPS